MRGGYSTYSTANVDTADQGKLILIAYDVAIKHCKLSLEKFGNFKLIEERTKHIYKVQDAVGELMSSLKMDVGDIAQNLFNLYSYIIKRLAEANIKSDPARVEEVLKYLIDLREAWSMAIKNIKQMSSANTFVEHEEGIAISG